MCINIKSLTLRINEVISCEGVPVLLVLQGRGVKVLADDMQVNVACVKHK
jgi:hypothetical protein